MWRLHVSYKGPEKRFVNKEFNDACKGVGVKTSLDERNDQVIIGDIMNHKFTSKSMELFEIL